MKRLTALFSLAALAACGDATPCAICPDVNGDYSVVWTDGGTRDEGCTREGPRPASWTFEQHTERVVTAVDGVAMGGTLYESFDLLLNGGTINNSYRLRALVKPGNRTLDGGTPIELTGTFTTRTEEDTTSCEVRDTFTATKL